MTIRSMLAAAALMLIAASAPAGAHEDAAASLPGTSLYNLDSQWVTQDGARIALSSLMGKLIVAAMGYAECKDICPAVVADMMWIDKHLPPGAASRVAKQSAGRPGPGRADGAAAAHAGRRCTGSRTSRRRRLTCP